MSPLARSRSFATVEAAAVRMLCEGAASNGCMAPHDKTGANKGTPVKEGVRRGGGRG